MNIYFTWSYVSRAWYNVCPTAWACLVNIYWHILQMMSGSVFHKSISGSRFKTPQQNFYCYLLEAIWSISSCLENVCATHIGNRWEKNKSGKPTSSAAASEVLLKWALYLNTIEEPSSQCCHGNRGTLDSDEKVLSSTNGIPAVLQIQMNFAESVLNWTEKGILPLYF